MSRIEDERECCTCQPSVSLMSVRLPIEFTGAQVGHEAFLPLVSGPIAV